MNTIAKNKRQIAKRNTQGKPYRNETLKDLLNWVRSLPKQGKRERISGKIDEIAYGARKWLLTLRFLLLCSFPGIHVTRMQMRSSSNILKNNSFCSIGFLKKHSRCYVINKGLSLLSLWKTKLETNKNITIYPLTQSEMRDVFAFAEQTKRKISVADYCVAYFAQKLQTDVLCFDKQLLSLIRKLRWRSFFLFFNLTKW